MITLGERIRIARDRAGLSQGKLAKELGLESGMAISNYESNQREPDVNKLITISEVGSVDPGWLLTGKGEMNPGPSSETVNEAGIEFGKSLFSRTPGSEFVLVPRYDIQASAGDGGIVHSEQIVDHLAFKSEWIRRELGLDPQKLVLISAIGDSMEPTIHTGDLLLLDQGAVKIKDDSLYSIFIDGTLLVKRIQRLIDGTIIVKSDNPNYREQTLTNDQVESLNIIGRVVWVGKRF